MRPVPTGKHAVEGGGSADKPLICALYSARQFYQLLLTQPLLAAWSVGNGTAHLRVSLVVLHRLYTWACILFHHQHGFGVREPIVSMRVGTFLLPHEAVALDQTFETVPELKIEAERIAAHSTEWVMPCVWAAQADVDAVDEMLIHDPTVVEIVEQFEFSDEIYYQIEWSNTVKHRIDRFLDMEASILAATADANGWRMRLRFSTREQFDTFREYLTEQGNSFTLLDLTQPRAPHQTIGELTPEQRNALVAANEHGYYAIPRKTTLRELAEELDISHQTLSEHLRRGTENLINATITT